MIKGIHHVSLKTRNDDEYCKVRAFYTDILGLKTVKECDACILLDTGSGIVEIFRNGTDEPESSIIRHYAFSVEDVDKWTETVRKAGYEVFVEPKDVCIGGDPLFPARVSFCRGPLGEEIEFFCQKWQ